MALPWRIWYACLTEWRSNPFAWLLLHQTWHNTWRVHMSRLAHMFVRWTSTRVVMLTVLHR